jgi:hypothetical protein
VQKALPVGEQVAKASFALGRRVDYFAGGVVGERRARHLADCHLDSFDLRADRFHRPRRQWAVLQCVDPFEQGAAIAEGLLGCGVGAKVTLQVPEQLVRRGDDVFDLGTRLGFEQGKGIDQHGRIADQVRRLLQFSKCRPRRNTLLQNGFCLQVNGGRKAGQIVVRLVSPPAASPTHVVETPFLRHVDSLCRRRRHVKKTCR